MPRLRLACTVILLALAACSTTAPQHNVHSNERSTTSQLTNLQAEGASREIVMYALGLLDVGYQFGGANPEAGLDCSGMVRFIYKQAIGMDLPHNAAEIAKRAQPVDQNSLQAGDLVFFNTRGFSFSHIGIYLGDNKFIHAPSSKGKIRVESLQTPYFAKRYQGGRSLLRG